MDHDGHPVRNLRKHLLDVIEKKLDSSSYTDLESFVTDLEQLIERCDTQIKRFSSESLAVKEIMKKAESDKSKVHLYLDTFKNRVTKSKPNLAVLLEMSTIDFTQCAISDNLQFQHLSFIQNEKTSVSVQTDKTTQTSVENLSISSTSTSECGEIRSRLEQYEDKLVKFETKSWYFRMKIEERRPLQIGPTYNFYFGNFRIELSANSLVPAKHDDVPAWWNDPFLHVNVKFHLIAAANSVLRIKHCKISLLNQKDVEKTCESRNYDVSFPFPCKIVWVCINKGAFLSGTSAWVTSENQFDIGVDLEYIVIGHSEKY